VYNFYQKSPTIHPLRKRPPIRRPDLPGCYGNLHDRSQD